MSRGTSCARPMHPFILIQPRSACVDTDLRCLLEDSELEVKSRSWGAIVSIVLLLSVVTDRLIGEEHVSAQRRFFSGRQRHPVLPLVLPSRMPWV